MVVLTGLAVMQTTVGMRCDVMGVGALLLLMEAVTSALMDQTIVGGRIALANDWGFGV